MSNTETIVSIMLTMIELIEKLTKLAKDDPNAWKEIRDKWVAASKKFDMLAAERETKRGTND